MVGAKIAKKTGGWSQFWLLLYSFSIIFSGIFSGVNRARESVEGNHAVRRGVVKARLRPNGILPRFTTPAAKRALPCYTAPAV